MNNTINNNNNTINKNTTEQHNLQEHNYYQNNTINNNNTNTLLQKVAPCPLSDGHNWCCYSIMLLYHVYNMFSKK